ncbi:MAG: HD domain-containing protein [Candidatus Levybacteria bacterium]|nr:HD domain-containing protein [Candidatus Levybacteria bacterium]
MAEKQTALSNENRDSFEARLFGCFSPLDTKNIMYAYDVAKIAHGQKLQKRDSGERYFEHPRAVALILLDECEIKDAAIIKGALIHDVLEDTGFFGNAHYLTYQQLIEEAEYRISLLFGEETAGIVIDVSKPNGTDMVGKTAGEIDDMYHRNLENAPAKSLLVKMADVLHNNRTLLSTTLKKQHHRVEETEGVYLDMFKRKVLPEYPNEGGYLLDQIKLAVNRTRLSWRK